MNGVLSSAKGWSPSSLSSAVAYSNHNANYLLFYPCTRCHSILWIWINKKSLQNSIFFFWHKLEGSSSPRFFYKKILAFFLESQLPWLAWTSWASCWPRPPWGAASSVPCRRIHQGHQHRNRWKTWEHHKWRIRRMRVAGNWKHGGG